MPRQPGQPVSWYNVDDGMRHPGTVEFECCQASTGGPFTVVKDEFGNEHLLTADQVFDLQPNDLTIHIMHNVRPPARPHLTNPPGKGIGAVARRRGLFVSPGMPISKLRAKGGK
jgi:hypothetical protein